MKKVWIAVAAAAASLLAPAVQAQDSGSWLVRGRAVHLNSANTNDGDLKAALGGAEVSINNKWLPEVDISYFFTPNLAAELILTYPQKHTVSVTGGTEVGTFKHLPPTLTVQYHVTGLGGFRPYVGAGLNYTNISDVQLGGLNLKRNSYGLAFQAGFDVPLGGGWMFNVDLKKVQIKTDVLSGDTKLGTFKVDPTLLGIGVGYRF